MKRFKSRALTFVLSFLLIGTLTATSAFASPLNQAPRIDHVNGFAGSAVVGLGMDDNVLRLTTNEIDDNYLSVNPELLYVARTGKHTFIGQYSGNYRKFDDGSELDYTEHKFDLGARLEHGSRFASRFELTYDDYVELPGENDLQTGINPEFNEALQKRYFAEGIYGKWSSTGQLKVSFAHTENDFKNNFQDFRDREADTLRAIFYYRISPKTRLLVEALDRTNDYTDPDTTWIDSDYRLYNLGADWRFSAKLRGVIKLGYQKTDYDREGFEDISGAAFFGDIFWDINSYTILQFGAERTTTESADPDIAGSFVRTNYQLNVKHEFTPRLHFEGDIQVGEDDLVFGGRTLDRTRFKAKLQHDTTKMFDTYVGIETFSRSSNDERYEFDNTQFSIGITGRFGTGF